MLLNTIGDDPLTDFQKGDLGIIHRSGMRALIEVQNGQIRQSEETNEGQSSVLLYQKK